MANLLEQAELQEKLELDLTALTCKAFASGLSYPQISEILRNHYHLLQIKAIAEKYLSET